MKLIVYMSWMTAHIDFVWVIIDYGIALLIVGVVQLVRRGPSTPWVIGSIVVSVIGALVQHVTARRCTSTSTTTICIT